MSRSVTVRTVAIEDRILAVLRYGELPMPAQKVADQIGRLPCWCRAPVTGDAISQALRAQVAADHATGRYARCQDGMRLAHYGDVYPRLVRLAKTDRVVKYRWPDGGVLWGLPIEARP